MHFGGKQSSVSYILSTFVPHKQNLKIRDSEMCFLSSPGGGGVTLDPSSLIFDISQLLVATLLAEKVKLLLLYSAWGQVRVSHLEYHPCI